MHQNNAMFTYLEIDCGDPPSIAHSQVAVSNTTLGGQTVYSCYTGYVFEDHADEHVLHCEDTGVLIGAWNPQTVQSCVG